MSTEAVAKELETKLSLETAHALNPTKEDHVYGRCACTSCIEIRHVLAERATQLFSLLRERQVQIDALCQASQGTDAKIKYLNREQESNKQWIKDLQKQVEAGKELREELRLMADQCVDLRLAGEAKDREIEGLRAGVDQVVRRVLGGIIDAINNDGQTRDFTGQSADMIAGNIAAMVVQRDMLIAAFKKTLQAREAAIVRLYGSALDESEPKARESIPMLLQCAHCGARHIDEGDLATRPHKVHACQDCGMHWQPALEPTVGVHFLPGCKDEGSSS